MLGLTQIFLVLAIYTVIVFVFIWIENRHMRVVISQKEKETQRRIYEVTILKELAERIGYSLNVQKIVDVVTGSLRKLLDYSAVSYLILNDDGRLIFHCILEQSVGKQFVNYIKQRMMDDLKKSSDIDMNSASVEERITGKITDESSRETVQSFFNIPIVISGQTVGILSVASTKPGLYLEEDLSIVRTIMDQASAAVSKLENILSLEKGKLNSMVSSMADGVLMVDQIGHLLVINPIAARMMSLPSSHPTMAEILAVLSPKMNLEKKINESVRKNKLIVEEELRLGDKVLRVLISPVKDQNHGSVGAVILFHDVTQEKALEKMRDEFTSMMVHELRSPLTGIRSIANLLKEDRIKSQQKKYQEFVDLIASNSASMLDLVNDLLDMAKLESGKFQILRKSTDIENLVRQRLSAFGSMIGSKVKLTSIVEPGIAPIQLDEIKIGQVLNNFISNAAKFTNSGLITVSAFILKKNQSLATKVKLLNLGWPGLIDTNFDSDSLILAVTDTGKGIAQDQMGKLFNKFTQLEQGANAEQKGTGLGLVITKGIVEAHSGTVGVFSEVGKGSTFYASLPIINQETHVRNR